MVCSHYERWTDAILWGTEHFRSLQILDELSNNDSLTQRDLSSRLGIALGLVNSYIKNLIAKGYITVKAIPTKRYAYYLTPKGFAEKTRLTYDLSARLYENLSGSAKKFKEAVHDLQENRGEKRSSSPVLTKWRRLPTYAAGNAHGTGSNVSTTTWPATTFSARP